MKDRLFFPLALVLAAGMVMLALAPGFGRLPEGAVAGNGRDYSRITIEGPYLNKVIAGGDATTRLQKGPDGYALYIEADAGVLNDAPELGPHFRLAGDIETLSDHGNTGLLDTSGPEEVAAIAKAANGMLHAERERIARRAAILSGISHDLGTPAARLRLRAALIGDDDLRRKFEADIDRMSEMSNSVLSFARHEMEAEDLREVSLTALLTAIADDYADAGDPVTLEDPGNIELPAPRSIFQSGEPASTVPLHDRRRILCTCRPIALRRAITNLIDNALKYGGAAHLSLTTGPGTVAIHVDDEGAHLPPEELERLVEPFARGNNARARQGIGLGLTIVDSVARLHGGSLAFAARPQGTRATLTLRQQIG